MPLEPSVVRIGRCWLSLLRGTAVRAEHGGPFDAAQLQMQLQAACEIGCFVSAEFLLAQGAVWPDELMSTTLYLERPDPDIPPWVFEHDTITWAFAHGFTGAVIQWEFE